MFPALAAALNDGDVSGALALYEPDAGFVTATGELARGDAGLRSEFDAMIAAKLQMSGEAVKTIVVKDIALVFVNYRASAVMPSGERFELTGLSTDVLRQQSDGTWLSVIDNPYGTALVAGQTVPREVIEATSA
jgi:uncharacterized protein (TIGR02246 family)